MGHCHGRRVRWRSVGLRWHGPGWVALAHQPSLLRVQFSVRPQDSALHRASVLRFLLHASHREAGEQGLQGETRTCGSAFSLGAGTGGVEAPAGSLAQSPGALGGGQSGMGSPLASTSRSLCFAEDLESGACVLGVPVLRQVRSCRPWPAQSILRWYLQASILAEAGWQQSARRPKKQILVKSSSGDFPACHS